MQNILMHNDVFLPPHFSTLLIKPNHYLGEGRGFPQKISVFNVTYVIGIGNG